MNAALREQLKEELAQRGFTDCTGPHGTLSFDDGFLDSIDILELLDAMVVRREKVFRSQGVVGADAARESFEDTVLVVDAIKTVLDRLLFK